MRLFRYSIANLLLLVLFVAVGIAALREASGLWDCVIFSGTLGLLVLATLLAVHRSGRSRAFWLGFVVGGSVYLAATLLPFIESRLITTRLLRWAETRATGQAIDEDLVLGGLDADGSLDLYVAESGPQAPTRAWLLDVTSSPNRPGTFAIVGRGPIRYAHRIGHSLLAVIIAVLTGLVSRRLHEASRRQTSHQVPAAPARPVNEA